jgi:hypothetical protein
VILLKDILPKSKKGESKAPESTKTLLLSISTPMEIKKHFQAKERQKFHMVFNETSSSSKARWKWREALPYLTQACIYLKTDK